MSIHWNDLENLLVEITKRDLQTFASKHAHERFYGFMFDCNADYGQVLLCLNSEESLQERAERCKRDNSNLYPESIAEIRASLRWNAGDWKYQRYGLQSDDFDAAWEPFETAVSDAWLNEVDEVEVEDEDTFVSAIQEQFMDSVCRVLIQLERQNAFQSLARTADFKTFVADHDECESDSWQRLARVRESVGG